LSQLCVHTDVLVVRAVCRRLLGNFKLDSRRVGRIAVWRQLAIVQQLELLAIRRVPIFRDPSLLNLDQIGIRRQTVISVECFFLLRSQIAIVVVVIIIVIVVIVNH